MTRSLLVFSLFALACKDDAPVTDDSTVVVGSDSAAPVDEDGDGSPSGEDCDDSNAAAYPGAGETCDGVDNDCDGSADEEASDAQTWWPDQDADSYGAGSGEVLACQPPEGFTSSTGDCDDNNPAYNPGASETDCSDPNDYNCDGSVGYADNDGDGFAACQECNDGDASINPSGTEVCDGLDNNCDGSVDEGVTSTYAQDLDGDGYGDPDYTLQACEPPAGYSTDSSDCDDADAGVHPDAEETCDSVDQDCDGGVDEEASDRATWYNDSDGDGYGDASSGSLACTQPSGAVSDSSDCDDNEASAYPGNSEVCDTVDNDCDGAVDEDSTDASVWYADSDGDSYGDSGSTQAACDQPSGFVSDSSDCDDSSAAVSPADAELCDSIDNNCDGSIDEASASDAKTWYIDADADTYGSSSASTKACSKPSGYTGNKKDCDDSDGAVYPGATEPCNGGDRDCDGVDAGDCSSCQEIVAEGTGSGDGLYNVDPLGSGSSVEVWCDMSTDGGGWTLAQRTVWAWSDSQTLRTGYFTWYNSTLGDADTGKAFRLAGKYWSALQSTKEHMLVHYARDKSSGGDCKPLYYLGSGGAYTVSSSSTSLSSITASVTMVNSTSLSTTDTGPSTTCVAAPYYAVPWFYSSCCTTCPTFYGSYWTDEPHPMASYINATADEYGNLDKDVCPSGAAYPDRAGSSYEGINVMEYYIR